MADLTKVVQRYEAQSDTSALEKYGAAADAASAKTQKLATSAGAVQTSTEKAEKSILAVSATLDRMAKAADPAIAAAAKLEIYQQKLAAAAKLGQPITATQAAGLAALKANYEKLTQATHEHSASVGLNRVQLMEASHVAKSFADSLVAGASPLRALSLEGGRIAQIFAEGSGGVGGTLKAMGATVGRLATGWLGFGAAVAAGAGLAGAAIIRFQSQQDKLALSLNGAGRYTGVSVGGLASIANAAGARNPYLGQGGATSLAATLASTGRISAGIMPGILDLAPGYARGTGQDLTKAGEELAKAFADPGKGAEMLNEKLGFLDDATKRSIESLERQGDLLGAQKVLLAKAADEAARMTDTTWSLAKAWDGFTSALGRGANAFAEGLHRTLDPTLSDRLDSALQQRAYGGRGPRGGPRASGASESAISAMRYGVAYQEYGQSRLAGTGAADKATNDLSIKIGDAVRKALPEVDKTQELTDTLKLLDDALRNPDVVSKTTGGAGAINLALSRTRNLRDNADPLQRIQQDASLSVQAAQADTGAERALVDARRAELEVMRSTGDATQAAAKALGVWNDEIAKSNKIAEDAVRSAEQRAGLIGLSPIGRALRENQYRYDELRRNSVTGAPGLSALSPSDLSMTALSPFGDLSSASQAFGGGKLTTRIIPGMHARSLAAYRELNPGTADTTSDVTVNGGAPVVVASRIGAYTPAARRFAPGNISVASTATGDLGRAQSIDAGAILDEMTTERIRRSSEELQRNRDLLDARTRAIGQNNDAILKAVHVQEDWNELQLTDNDKKLLGATRVKQLGDQIDTLATKQTDYDRQQKQYETVANASNWFQQTGDSAVSGLGSTFGDLFNANPRNLVSQLKVGDQAKFYAGQLSGSDVKQKVFAMQAGNFLRNLLFQQGIGMIQKGLFGSGQYGTPGYQSGIFGGVFNSLLGGVGGLFGSGSGGGSASGLSSLFSGAPGAGFGSLFADGGIMTSRGPLPLRKYAGGGVANSPQVAVYGEGAGPEAYVPLPDGRRIPVAMSGGHGSQINFGGHTVIIQGSADDKTAALIDSKLAAANKQMMTDLQRNMGQMNAKWQLRIGS